MLCFTPETLAQWTHGTWHGLPAEPIRGFRLDSRRVQPGDLFFALRTEVRDGHDFVGAARAAGAVGAVVERLLADCPLPQLVVESPERALQAMARAHRRGFPGKVIGITGSCGKTSCKEMLAALLGRERTHFTEGNLNNHLGLPLTLLGLDPERHDQAVVEAGINHTGEMDVLGHILQPDAAIITHIGEAHLAGLGGDLAGVAREKSNLLRHVRSGGFAAYPAACLAYAPFAEPPPQLEKIFLTGMELPAPKADTRFIPTNYKTDSQNPGDPGGDCLLCVWQSPARVEEIPGVPRLSAGMLSNLVLAWTVACALGVPADTLRGRIAQWQPSFGRADLRIIGGRTYFVDCYNANPASMRDSLRFFQERFPQPPRCYVLGGMKELGVVAPAAHREAAALLRLEAADTAIFVGEEGVWYREGLPPPMAAAAVADADAARPLVEASDGPVFLKGSRAYALEKLLPAEARAC
jgi:UDP-N-acetylmuramoyl-tripeptide--D-alanyl-D-alanine ligase